MFWGKRVKKQGFSGSKNRHDFASVSVVCFEKTVKLAAPQNRSALCSKSAIGRSPDHLTPLRSAVL